MLEQLIVSLMGRCGPFRLRFHVSLLVACLAFAPWPVLASERGDAVVLDMAAAFKKGDRKRLTQLLPQARGHMLEPWAAYWELRARLDEASHSEIRDFLNRYPNTYQEDRLRNDWLLLLEIGRAHV